MARISRNPGRVEWSGESPGIYLKDNPKSDHYDTLALFFRVNLSPYGRGHAALVLGAPDEPRGWPDVPNVLLTDNMHLMRWIVEGWVAKMPDFAGQPGLGAMTWLYGESVEKCAGDIETRYSETLSGPGLTLEMTWLDMHPPISLEATKENSPTKAHEMYSVLLSANAAEVKINGQELKGKVAERHFLGRTMPSAFLSFSETWITPEEEY